jgi:hypothetical protein
MIRWTIYGKSIQDWSSYVASLLFAWELSSVLPPFFLLDGFGSGLKANESKSAVGHPLKTPVRFPELMHSNASVPGS